MQLMGILSRCRRSGRSSSSRSGGYHARDADISSPRLTLAHATHDGASWIEPLPLVPSARAPPKRGRSQTPTERRNRRVAYKFQRSARDHAVIGSTPRDLCREPLDLLGKSQCAEGRPAPCRAARARRDASTSRACICSRCSASHWLSRQTAGGVGRACTLETHPAALANERPLRLRTSASTLGARGGRQPAGRRRACWAGGARCSAPPRAARRGAAARR